MFAKNKKLPLRQKGLKEHKEKTKSIYVTSFLSGFVAKKYYKPK